MHFSCVFTKNILKRSVKSLSFLGLGRLGFDLVERFVKEQSYEESIWYHVCFNNESNNEIIKMSWTRFSQKIVLRIYIHNISHHARHARLSSISSNSHARRARPSSNVSMLITWFSCSRVKQFEQYACYDATAYPWYWFITC